MNAVESGAINAYSGIQSKLAQDECVILDAANATELQRQGVTGFQLSDSTHWGFDALNLAPLAVQTVHQSYVDAGADIITTNTYAILEAPTYTRQLDIQGRPPLHWMDMARHAVRLGRNAIAEGGKDGKCALAFSIGGDIETADELDTVRLLLRVFEDTPPDLVLFETLSLMQDNNTLAAIELLIEAGYPVWTSFRRCREGVCGIYGQLWGGPEGDHFGRLAQKLERLGVGALLINCLPIPRIEGTLPWLRDYTQLPLGVYPNTGRHLDPGWLFDDALKPDQFADLALRWRAEGAQIIGGCCGVGPAEIRAFSEKVRGLPAGDPGSSSGLQDGGTGPDPVSALTQSVANSEPWADQHGRALFPLPFPEIAVDPGVFVPTQGSYVVWKHLFNNKLGEGQRCLDVGCGAGLLAVQLALNGAESVAVIDIEKAAVANTLTNAFRNNVADRVKGEVVDLFAFAPSETYELIVASLYQMPTDPKGKMSGHRPIDFWGRNLMDHFISLLPTLLAENGVAYVMQVSLLGQNRTIALLDQMGLESKVIDFNMYDFGEVFKQNIEQIDRVEMLSDSFHFNFGGQDVMVMYLIEITRK